MRLLLSGLLAESLADCSDGDANIAGIIEHTIAGLQELRRRMRSTRFDDIPVADMIDRGWLQGINDIEDPELDSALFRFFDVTGLSELEELMGQKFPNATPKKESQ